MTKIFYYPTPIYFIKIKIKTFLYRKINFFVLRKFHHFYRYLLKDKILFFFHAALREGRDLVALCPFFLKPLLFLPDEVIPRNSLCL
jgi:hypothetical protein